MENKQLTNLGKIHSGSVEQIKPKPFSPIVRVSYLSTYILFKKVK